MAVLGVKSGLSVCESGLCDSVFKLHGLFEIGKKEYAILEVMTTPLKRVAWQGVAFF
jgi:hypothetical protein